MFLCAFICGGSQVIGALIFVDHHDHPLLCFMYAKTNANVHEGGKGREGEREVKKEKNGRKVVERGSKRKVVRRVSPSSCL